MQKDKELEKLPLFEGVKKETMQELKLRGRMVTLEKGTVCYRAAQSQENLFILLEGQAIIYTLTGSGNRKIIFIYGAGELLNESIIASEKTTVFCELIRTSRLFVIANRDFCRLMQQDFALVQATMRVQERKLWRTSHQLKNTLGSIYLEKKLAAKLWKLARDFGRVQKDGKEQCAQCGQRIQTGMDVWIDINLSVTLLADLLGAPRETTSRICKSLMERGLITMERKQVIVRDMDALAHFYKS